MELQEIFEQWAILIAMVGGTILVGIAISIALAARTSLILRLKSNPQAVNLARQRDFGNDVQTFIDVLEKTLKIDIKDAIEAKIVAEARRVDVELENVQQELPKGG